MDTSEILTSLDDAWERDAILLKIKNGLDSDEIVNEFLIDNEVQVKELTRLLRPEDIHLLSQIEQLSTCEAKLINKINSFNYLNNEENHYAINLKRNNSSNRSPSNRISLFMINWSNKFVVIALLTISAIALSKQAWA